MADFQGRAVILTGATGGFGQAAARHFAKAGAKLVLSDLGSDRLDALADELGGQAIAVGGDISDPELSERLVKAGAVGIRPARYRHQQCRDCA
jgi:NADP-dependent 3-hydroxy acid dehydrogenase YdfG